MIPPLPDLALIHSSTRTMLSTNADIAGARRTQTMRITRLEIRWLDGVVAVRFSANHLDVMPRPRMTRRGR